MGIVGIVFIVMAITIMFVVVEDGKFKSFLFFIFFLGFGVSGVVVDINIPRDEIQIIDSYNTNKIPIEYENPDNIDVSILKIEDENIYLKNNVTLNKFERRSKYKIFIFKKYFYTIGELK